MAHIVIIEDDPLMRHWVVSALQVEGHEVSSAANGIEALTLWRGKAPDLVITDLFMPECDGMEVIAALRRSHPETPIIAISGHSAKPGLFLKVAERLGAQTTLQKPFSAGELFSTVNRVLGRPVRLTP